MSIVGSTIGVILKNPKTIILRNDDGNEYPATMTTEEVTLTANANDVRLGKTVVVQEGVITGEKEIPSYNTMEGAKLIMPGSEFRFSLTHYEYTKLQSLICKFNTSMSDSVSTDRVGINDNIYPTNSTNSISSITIDDSVKEVVFGITNDSDIPYIIRFFTYKEIY